MEWDPLEVVLSAWLGMIDTGKVIAKAEGTDTRGPVECTPWELGPYSEHDLAHAVSSFNNLTARVECLIEDPSLSPLENPDDQNRLLEACTAKLNPPASAEEFGLIPRDVLDSAAIPEGFIREFLLQVRRPKNIKFVAPGLRLPTPGDFTPHPFQNSDNRIQWSTMIPFFPCLSSSQEYNRQSRFLVILFTKRPI